VVKEGCLVMRQSNGKLLTWPVARLSPFIQAAVQEIAEWRPRYNFSGYHIWTITGREPVLARLQYVHAGIGYFRFSNGERGWDWRCYVSQLVQEDRAYINQTFKQGPSKFSGGTTWYPAD